MTAWETIAALVLAYLLGSVSFAWIFAKKLKGIDLRTFGSGNLGATNAGRLLGRKYAIIIYLLDFAKGWLPVVVLRTWVGDPVAAGTVPVALVAGIAAFVGHCFPAWHGFRGGKGVATASGVIFGLTPIVALIVLGIFTLTVALSRRISAASIAGAAALPFCQLAVREGSTPSAVNWTLWLYAAMSVLVIARHHENVKRLLKGEEPKIGARP
jgi:glycerol-3-phosphate acyltransferase PlsY